MVSTEVTWEELMADADPRGAAAALGEGAAAVPRLKELAASGLPGAGPLLALETLGEMAGESAEWALFELVAGGDEGVAWRALRELAPRLETRHAGRVLALLERRVEPALRAPLYELATRLAAPLGHVRQLWADHPPTDEEEGRAALLALHLLGDSEAYGPLLASLCSMDPVDAAGPLESVRSRPADTAAARLLIALFKDTRLVDRAPPRELDLDLGPGLRVCDLASICAIELFGDKRLSPQWRRYDDAERADLAAAILPLPR